MKLMHAMSALVIGGALLVVVSFVWPALVGGRNAWSDKQAKEHAELSAEGHHLRHAQAEGPAGHDKTHPSKSAKEKQKEYEAAREKVDRRFAEVNADLRSAQNRGATTALVLRILGVVCTVVGGAGYFALRNKDR